MTTSRSVQLISVSCLPRLPPSSHFPQLKFRTRILISDMWWRVNLHLQNSSRYVLFGFSDDNIMSTLRLFCLFEACFVLSKPFLHNISRNIPYFKFLYFWRKGKRLVRLCPPPRRFRWFKIHKNPQKSWSGDWKVKWRQGGGLWSQDLLQHPSSSKHSVTGESEANSQQAWFQFLNCIYHAQCTNYRHWYMINNSTLQLGNATVWSPSFVLIICRWRFVAVISAQVDKLLLRLSIFNQLSQGSLAASNT